MRDNDRGPSVLGTGDYLGLKFENGWWFTHIIENETIELKPWILLNENQERAEIAPQTAGYEDDMIEDTSGRKYIVPNSDEKNLIYQVRYGISPSRMQAYPIFGRDRSPNLKGTAEPGQPQVPVTGFDSPYNSPSRQSEIFTVNSMAQPSIQAYNPMDEPEEARLSFHVTKLKYATITDVDLMNSMLQGQVSFRNHSMGLGAQNRDQIRTPTWLDDNFGDSLLTTREIMQQGSSSGDSSTNGSTLPESVGGGN